MASQGLRPAGAVAKTGTSSAASTPVAWAIGFLKGIGAPTTPNNINTVIAWGIAESGAPGTNQGHGGWTNFNPLNVVSQPGDNSVGQGGSQGNIADFGDLTSGVAASVRLFSQNPNAFPIIQSLRNNSPRQVVSDAINGFYRSWDPSSTFSITGVNVSGANTNLGGGTHQATTTSKLGDIGKVFLDPGYGLGKALGALGIQLPGSGVLKGVDAVFSFFAGLLNNWRMLVQFVGGLAMIGVGFLLILHDTGIDRKAAGAGAKIVAIGAAA